MKIRIPILSKKQLKAALQLNANRSAFAVTGVDDESKPRKPPPPVFGAECDNNVGTG